MNFFLFCGYGHPLVSLQAHFLTHSWVLLVADGNTGIQTLLFLCVYVLWFSSAMEVMLPLGRMIWDR